MQMTAEATQLDTLEFANLLVEAILDKKGSDILLLDMQEQVIFSDYFLLCNGQSNRQIKALVNGMLEEAKQKAREIALSVEGNEDDGWMLIDFGAVVVHIFDPEKREYYDLEELWQDARVVLRMQ
jgi:ribosome-associated protein